MMATSPSRALQRDTFSGAHASVTLTRAPRPNTEVVVLNTLVLFRVASSPGNNEYTLAGATVTFGTAMVSGDVCEVRYA